MALEFLSTKIEEDTGDIPGGGSPLTLDPAVATMSPLQKAEYYNTLIGQGYTDPVIRAAAGTQTDTDWSALQSLAAGLAPSQASQPSGALNVATQSQQATAPSSYNDIYVNALYSNIIGSAPSAQERARLLEAMERGTTGDVLAQELYRAKYADAAVAPAAGTSLVSGAAPAAQPVSGALQGALQGAVAGTQPVTGSPEWFKQYMYQGGADDATATQRGLEYISQQGMQPLEAVNLWNQALGTQFSVNDFYRVGDAPAPSTTTVFGDSISSVVGYNRDGSADTSQGKSLEDILSNYTGGVVNNVATGGQTSQDALSGNTGYGSFEQYVKTNHPDQVILRYGAADAIKMGDANASLNNIEQMINIARQNGSTPVLVGVSPFFGGADSIGGNIAGYLTRDSAAVADQINAGIQQLAQKYGLQFVDVRQVDIPAGSLLDGVHQDVRLGKAMADKIGQSIAPAEEKKTINRVTPEQAKAGETGAPAGALPSVAAQTTTGGAAQQAAAGTPQAALQQAFAQNPNFANDLIIQQGIEDAAREGGPKAEVGYSIVGDYLIRPVTWEAVPQEEGFYNPYGAKYNVSAFEIFRVDKTPEGKPLEFTSLTDDKGNITSTRVRYFTGGDSGIVFDLDAQGNQIGEARGFDYSEDWKAPTAQMLSIAAMAFAGPLSQTLATTLGGGAATFASNVAANAIVRGGLSAAQAALMGGDPLKAGLTGAVTGAVGVGAAQIANDAAAQVLSATGSQVAADAVRGAVQAGLNAAPGAVVSGDLGGLGKAALTGAVTSGIGSAASQALSGTGITPQQISSGLTLAQQLQSGKPNISVIANAAAGLINNPDATVAAKAISLVDTISKAGSNPMALMGIMDAAAQLSQAANTGSAAYVAAKNAGATDAEAAVIARQMTGGDAIDQATARATGLPITYGAIPDIEIIDEEYGDLTQAQKDAAQRNTLKVASGEASTPEEAAALAKSRGFGMFEFGGNRYTLGASVQEVLAAAGQAEQAKQEAGTTGKEAAKIVPGWGREGNLIQGFNNATVGTTNQARAAELLRQVYGNAVDWVDQGTLNTAASYIYANREDLLLKDLQAGDIKGIGAYGIKTPQDITSVAKDYIVEGGARIAGPAEVSGADVGYDANGVPIAVVKTAGTTTGKKMTEEERNRYDFEMGLEEARKQTDPFTGESLAINPITGKEFTFDDFQNSSTVRDTIRGIAAPVMKGVGELGQLAGYATGITALTEAAANLEAQGRSITPQVVREGTTNLINDIQNADGMLNKGKAIVNAFIERPWQTAAAVADLTGTELTQEFLPFGASLAAGRAVSAATRAKFGQLVSERAGTIAGVTANATSDGIEAGLQTAQQVYNDLRAQGFGHERATDMAFKAGVLSSVVETAASVVGEGPMMSGLVKGVPGSVVRTTVREGISEFPAGYLQTAIGDIATNRLGTFDPNAAQTGGYLETLAGGPTSGVIQAGGNIFTQAGEAAAGTAGTQAATTSTQATAPTTAPTTTSATDTGAVAGTTVTQTGQDAATIINDYVTTVLQGGDASTAASTSVSNIINSAVTGGADVSQAASTAVGSIINSAASSGANVSAVTSSSVSGAVTSAVTSGADVAAVTQSAVGSAVTSAVNSGLDATTAVNSAVGGAVAGAATSGADVAATINSAVGSAVTSAVTSGSDVSTAVTSAVGSAVTSAVTNGSDASTAVTSAVTSSVSSAVTSAVNTGADVSTAVTSAVNSAVSTAVNTAVNTGTDVSTAVNTAVNSAVTTAVTTAVNTGQSVNTAVNTAVTSAVTTAVNTAVNTGQSVNTAVNTAVNSAVTAAVSTGVSTNVAVSAAVDAVKKLGYDDATATKLVNDSATTLTAETPRVTPTTLTTATPPVTPKTPPAPAPAPSGSYGVMAAAPTYPYTPTSPRETWTGGMFRNIPAAPNLAALAALFNLMPEQQESQAISALQRASGVTPSGSDYFSYGTEPSPSEVIGSYRKGGNVQSGGSGDKMLSSPLMAAAGGDVPHKGSHYVQGAGGGQDDLIPAKLADGEYVFDAEIVAALGDGSNKEGAKKLDAMREAIRKHKRSGSVKTIPPAAKSPLQYLKEATK